MFSENSYLSPRARRLASGRRRGREGPASDPHPLECGLAAGVTLSLGTDLQLLAEGTGRLPAPRTPQRVLFCCFYTEK